MSKNVAVRNPIWVCGCVCGCVCVGVCAHVFINDMLSGVEGTSFYKQDMLGCRVDSDASGQGAGGQGTGSVVLGPSDLYR